MSIPKETRRESYEAIAPTLKKRQRIVLNILWERGDMTAQQVADTLCFLRITPTNERNFAAPRLTELCEMWLVLAVGKRTCKKTGRTVTVWSAVKESVPQKPPDAQIQFEMKACSAAWSADDTAIESQKAQLTRCAEEQGYNEVSVFAEIIITRLIQSDIGCAKAYTTQNRSK